MKYLNVNKIFSLNINFHYNVNEKDMEDQMPDQVYLMI